MNIASRIWNIFAPRTAGASTVKPVLKLPLAQLAQLSTSELAIGPLPGKVWDRHFTDCFLRYLERSPQFPKYFPNAVSFLLAEKRPPELGSATREKVIASLQLQFNNYFITHVASKSELSFEQTHASAMVFLALKELSARIDVRRQTGKPLADLIENSNRFFARAANKLDFKLVVG